MIKHQAPSTCPPYETSAGGASRRQAKFQINSNQKYLKFPLTPTLSPKGRGLRRELSRTGRVRGSFEIGI